MNKVLICYDIKEEKRRAKIRKLSKARGQHHQLSIFLIHEGSIRNISEALGAFVEQEVDRLLVAKLRGKELKLGKPYETYKWRL